jgi:hypothetical protein
MSVLIAALFGLTVSLVVSAFVPESRWTILQWLLVVPFTGSMQDLVGPTYVAFHRGLFYAITATFHALFLMLILLLVYRFAPRLRRRAWFTMAVLLLVDIVFMVYVFPAGTD